MGGSAFRGFGATHDDRESDRPSAPDCVTRMKKLLIRGSAARGGRGTCEHALICAFDWFATFGDLARRYW